MGAEDRDIMHLLARRLSHGRPDRAGEELCQCLCGLGASMARLYLADYDHAILHAVAAAPRGTAQAPDVPVDRTPGGTAFSTRQVVTADTDLGHQVWIPVTERSDRLGVIELLLASPDLPVAGSAAEIGLVTGQFLHSAARYTDVFDLRRRHYRMNLAAEIQWSMLIPALSFTAPAVTLAGALEPSYDIAGDGFDYAAQEQILDLCVLDAVGHDLHSTLVSALALGAHRHGRRQGLDLTQLAQMIDQVVGDEWENREFATGHLAQIDLTSGRLSWINAGHPAPLVIRDGRVADELNCASCLPLGYGIRITEVGEYQLQPGDQLLFYTDGATEARGSGPGHEQFGFERLCEVVEAEFGTGPPLPQTLRRVIRHIIKHRDGQPLDDDVTLLACQWHPQT